VVGKKRRATRIANAAESTFVFQEPDQSCDADYGCYDCDGQWVRIVSGGNRNFSITGCAGRRDVRGVGAANNGSLHEGRFSRSLPRMSALKVKFDFEILPEQRAPLVDQRLSFIDKLRDKIREHARRIEALEREVNRLRGLPETPVRSSVQPSGLERPTPPPPSGRPARRRKRKRRPPGNRAKLRGGRPDGTIVIAPVVVDSPKSPSP